MWLGRVKRKEKDEKENWMELDVEYKNRGCKAECREKTDLVGSGQE